jgi:BirA family transcriptional regulator, biotin operon repressor / biotin---[acetyl-CoA-carboxylase] ligase
LPYQAKMLTSNFKGLIGNSFVELPTVDSTNNYSVQKVHAGLAFHGNVFFAHEQFAGKGQFGKKWNAAPDQNIIMSVVLEPDFLTVSQQFFLSVCVADACVDLLNNYVPGEFLIKWPNDLYWRDRKIGGILIENILQGDKWKFAIAGIGINIKQVEFPNFLPNAVSLKQIIGKTFSPVALAKELCNKMEEKYQQLRSGGFDNLLREYNKYLFRKNEKVRLKKENIVFETMVIEVTPDGQLHTKDAIDRYFNFGEVEWIIDNK